MNSPAEQGALDCVFEEIEIADQMDDYMMCSAALANIAYVYQKAKAFDKAEQTLERAYEMAEKVIYKTEELLATMASAGKWSKLMKYEIRLYTATKIPAFFYGIDETSDCHGLL